MFALLTVVFNSSYANQLGNQLWKEFCLFVRRNGDPFPGLTESTLYRLPNTQLKPLPTHLSIGKYGRAGKCLSFVVHCRSKFGLPLATSGLIVTALRHQH